jgi:hypothetical protein
VSIEAPAKLEDLGLCADHERDCESDSDGDGDCDRDGGDALLLVVLNVEPVPVLPVYPIATVGAERAAGDAERALTLDAPEERTLPCLVALNSKDLCSMLRWTSLPPSENEVEATGVIPAAVIGLEASILRRRSVGLAAVTMTAAATAGMVAVLKSRLLSTCD